jgi:hypothetical protein
MQTIAQHDTMREGTRLGLIVATGIWIWLAAVDVIVSQPFHTFNVLGGITWFTAFHYALNVAYGIAVMAAFHGSEREPGLMMAVTFGVVIVQTAVAMTTVLLAHLGLGDLAWVRIFGGSLIGATIAIIVLARRHPPAVVLRRADDEQNG